MTFSLFIYHRLEGISIQVLLDLRDLHTVELVCKKIHQICILSFSSKLTFIAVRIKWSYSATIGKTVWVFRAVRMQRCYEIFSCHWWCTVFRGTGDLWWDFQTAVMVVTAFSTPGFIVGLWSALYLWKVWSIVKSFNWWIFGVWHKSCSP